MDNFFKEADLSNLPLINLRTRIYFTKIAMNGYECAGKTLSPNSFVLGGLTACNNTKLSLENRDVPTELSQRMAYANIAIGVKPVYL